MFNRVLEYLKASKESVDKVEKQQDESLFQEELRFWGISQISAREQTFQAQSTTD